MDSEISCTFSIDAYSCESEIQVCSLAIILKKGSLMSMHEHIDSTSTIITCTHNKQDLEVFTNGKSCALSGSVYTSYLPKDILTGCCRKMGHFDSSSSHVLMLSQSPSTQATCLKVGHLDSSFLMLSHSLSQSPSTRCLKMGRWTS